MLVLTGMSVTGYYIGHFAIEWGLSMKHAKDDNIDLLLKNLRSFSTANGKTQALYTFT